MKKSVVVFDFDGVLTKGGEGLKQKAWRMLSQPWSYRAKDELRKEIHEQAQTGIGSRVEILHNTFTALELDPEGVPISATAYAACYNTIVQKLLEQSGMPEGTEQALVELAKGRELFVNSATPEKAVRESVQNFGIAHYFRGIFGQPISKRDNLERAMKIARVDRGFMLFVGDGESDAKAAEEFGCDFVGIPNDWNKWTPETVKFPLIDSIAELPALL